MPDNDKITVEYEELRGHEKGGKTRIYIGKLLRDYSISRLLDGIESRKERTKEYTGSLERPFFIENAYFTGPEVKEMTTISVQLGDNATFHGDFIVANKIEESFNNVCSADAPEDLKDLLKSLAIDVGKVLEQLPKEQVENTVNDLQTFLSEAISKKPRQKWWKLSADGIIEAANTVGAIGVSALKNIDKIIPVLQKLC